MSVFSDPLGKAIGTIGSEKEAIDYVVRLGHDLSPLHLCIALVMNNDWFVSAIIKLGHSRLIRHANYQPLISAYSLKSFTMMLEVVSHEVPSDIILNLQRRPDRMSVLALLKRKSMFASYSCVVQAIEDEDLALVDFYLNNYSSRWPVGFIFRGEPSIFSTVFTQRDERCMKILIMQRLYHRDIAVSCFVNRADILSIDEFVEGALKALCQDRMAIKATIVGLLRCYKINRQTYDVFSIMRSIVNKHGVFSQMFLFEKPRPPRGFYNDWVKLLSRMWEVIDF